VRYESLETPEGNRGKRGGKENSYRKTNSEREDLSTKENVMSMFFALFLSTAGVGEWG
jgi:hypothetical protein